MPEFRIGAATHTGRIRPENEDAFVATAPVFAVADGMGGHQAGEVASAMAVDTLRAMLAGTAGLASVDDLIQAVKAANRAILQAANDNTARRGMGTTITAISVLAPSPANPTRLALANVGDSRAYLVRNRVMQQLSIDHSYVQDLVASGQITKDEARTHPHRNIVTRALGIEPELYVDAWTLPLVRGDRFMLCSDGLVDEVPDDAIEELLIGIENPQQAAESLVSMANRHGGRDNTTVVVVDVLKGDRVPADPYDIGLEPHTSDSDAEAAWTDDMRLDDTPPATQQLTGLPDPSGPAVRPEPAELPEDPTGPLSRSSLARKNAEADAAAPVVPTTSRFNWRVLAFLVALGAIIVAAITFTAVEARDGYHVGFDGTDVVVYKGHQLLWFSPTIEERTELTRADLQASDIAQIERNDTFASITAAQNYLTSLKTLEEIAAETAASTTTTVTTTTAATATTAAPSTVPTTTAGAGG
jgi:protein phosphatase